MKSKPVNAVLNALRLLNYLGDVSEPVTVTRACRALGMSPSTAFTILRTMAQAGYVVFDLRTKVYALGHSVIDLADKAMRIEKQISRLRGPMEAIANAHSVTVTIWQSISAEERVLLFTYAPVGDMTIHMKIGQKLPLYAGAPGLVLAAYTEPEVSVLKKQFKNIAWVRPRSFEDYLADIQQTRSRGWGADNGEFFAGMCSTAVPVFDMHGKVSTVLTGTMFSHLRTQGRVRALAKALLSASRRM